MILSDIRYLVGLDLGQKGLPAKIIAPVLNILSMLDTELSALPFEMSPALQKELDRLNFAIILQNEDAEEVVDVDEDEDEDDDDWYDDDYDDDLDDDDF